MVQFGFAFHCFNYLLDLVHEIFQCAHPGIRSPRAMVLLMRMNHQRRALMSSMIGLSEVQEAASV